MAAAARSAATPWLHRRTGAKGAVSLNSDHLRCGRVSIGIFAATEVLLTGGGWTDLEVMPEIQIGRAHLRRVLVSFAAL